MKRMNNKGFGAVEVVLILVVVGILGFVGYQAYTVYTAGEDKDGQLSEKVDEEEEREAEEDNEEVSIKIISTDPDSPNNSYNISVIQVGDSYQHTLIDNKTDKKILDNHVFEYSNLPGYNKDWFCQCGGPEFKGWSSDKYFVVEIRAQYEDQRKMLQTYHIAVDASTGKLVEDTFTRI